MLPPPHDTAAEESLLGALMLAADAWTATTSAGITAADFYHPRNAAIYTAIAQVRTRGEHADHITVAAALNGTLDKIGGRTELLRIHNATPASANAAAYARIVRDHARRRQMLLTAEQVRDTITEGGDPAGLAAELAVLATPIDPGARLTAGGTFACDVPDTIAAIWGTDDRVLWADGESLLIVGPPGVGKTTLIVQLVEACCGITDHVLGLPVTPTRRVLYLACDRPKQIARAFHRLGHTDVTIDERRAVLDERLVVWSGPPPADLGRSPATLAALCRKAGADTVIIDSLKDVAIGLSDDEVAAGLNSAIQHCLADGIQVAANHHQRKGQAGQKPKALEDVYGSTWITAGAGSVVLLWGQPGDPIVDLHHLKQPAGEVGPLKVDHDHNTGRSTIFRGDVDPLRVLRAHANGMTALDLAQLTTGNNTPNDVARRKAKRVLDRLVVRHLAHRVDGTKGGDGGTNPDRYYALDTTHDD